MKAEKIREGMKVRWHGKDAMITNLPELAEDGSIAVGILTETKDDDDGWLCGSYLRVDVDDVEAMEE